MSTTAAPYGLIPVKKIGGQPHTGSFTQYPISSAYSTAIFQGDIVSLTTASGYLAKNTGTTSATPIGVFIGCSYVDSTYGLTFKNQWPASQAGTSPMAFVVDDPDVVFKIQGDGLGTIYDYESIGCNAALIQGSGSTSTGISAVALDSSSVANTGTLPVKIVGWDKSPSNAIADTYVDFLVTLNTHFLRATTANAAT
jgi:hypothetical protein